MHAYTVGMKDEHRQYTLRDIPPALDRALRERAQQEGKSLNQVAREALKRGVGLPDPGQVSDDLDALAGSWQDDPAFDEAIRQQDTVDPEAWR
jgi:plasmid stability protein